VGNKALKRQPNKMVRVLQSDRDDWWFYEEPGGLCVVRSGGGFATIPLRAIKDYLKRLESG